MSPERQQRHPRAALRKSYRVLWRRLEALDRSGEVDAVVEGTRVRRPHRPVHAPAAEQDGEPGPACLQPARQRQARHDLVERAGEADDVGLLRFDLPDQERTARRVIEPALERHGLALTTDIAFRPVEGTRDLPVASDEASNAVLRMRSRGVDRVLFLGSGLSLPYVFPTVAESQGYRPRYGITTDDGPAFMAENAPAAQMSGAMAVGWEPQYDVADSDGVLRDQPQWRACVAVVKRAGFTARDGRRCTALYFLEAALRRSSTVTPAALRAGADRLGATAYSTQTYATRFGPGRYDGVAAVRVLRLEESCTCFRYLTGNLRTP